MSDVSLSLIVIRTRQLPLVRAFYEAIGIPFCIESHGTGPEHLAANLNGTIFEIYPGEEPAGKSVRLGFTVRCLADVLATLRTESVEPREVPTRTAWGYRAVVVDPDGRKVELLERQQPIQLASSPCEAPPGYWGDEPDA